MPDREPAPERSRPNCPVCGSALPDGSSSCRKCSEGFEAPPTVTAPPARSIRRDLRALPGLRFDSIGGAMWLIAVTAVVLACASTYDFFGILFALFLIVVTAWFVALVQGSRSWGVPIDSEAAGFILLKALALSLPTFVAGCFAFMGTCTVGLLFARPKPHYFASGGSMVFGFLGFFIAVLLLVRALSRRSTFHTPIADSPRVDGTVDPDGENGGGPRP